MMKKYLPILLSALLCLSLTAGLWALPAAAADAVLWDGKTADGFAGGTGTEADPYLIATPGQLAYFSALVNKDAKKTEGVYYALSADILLNDGDAAAYDTPEGKALAFTPIGTGAQKFAGTFDGKGHTVSGLFVNINNDCAGLFGYVGSAGTVRNLVLVNARVQGNDKGNEAGGLAGCAVAGALIENVFVDAIVNGLCDGTGGVVGIAGTNAGATLTVRGCVFAGTVGQTDRKWVGGIVGNGNNKAVIIENCLNLGSVIGSDLTAGIMGIDNTADVTVSGCVNLGSVQCTGNNRAAILCTNAGAAVSDCFYLASSCDKDVAGDAAVRTNVNPAEKFNAFYGEGGGELAKTLTGWTVREGDVLCPAGVAVFMPATAYRGNPSLSPDYEEETNVPLTTTVPEETAVPDAVSSAAESTAAGTAAPAKPAAGCGGSAALCAVTAALCLAGITLKKKKH